MFDAEIEAIYYTRSTSAANDGRFGDSDNDQATLETRPAWENRAHARAGIRLILCLQIILEINHDVPIWSSVNIPIDISIKGTNQECYLRK